MTGMSASTADGVLAAVFQGTSLVVTGLWAQLHVGDPGAAGTANPAVESTRVDVSAAFQSPAADDGTGAARKLANDSILGPWVAVAADETYSQVSFWTASSGGTFVGSGTVTGASVTAGDDFAVPVGDCVVKLPCAA